MKLLISWTLVALTAVHVSAAATQHSRVVRATSDSYSLNNIFMEAGVMKETRINNYGQKDLAPDKMYSLVNNANGNTYFWVGRFVPKAKFNELFVYTALYISMHPNAGRYFKFQRQGEEDPEFIAGFDKWD